MATLAESLLGIASQTEQNQGAGMPQAVAQGAQLALNKQRLDQAQQMMQQKMQEIQNEKFTRVASTMTDIGKMPPGVMRDTAMQWMQEKMIPGLGLQSSIDPTVMKMMRKEPMLGAQLISGVQNGKYQYDVLAQPDKAFAAYPELQTSMNADELSRTVADYAPDMLKAGQESLQRQEQQRKDAIAQQRADTSDKRADAAIAAAGAGRELKTQAADDKLAGDIRTKYTPIAKEQTSLSAALDARDRIAQQLLKDPSGATVSPQDKGALVYSLLHTELGRVNHAELADQLNIPGWQNMAQNEITKAIGGVNPNVIPGLFQRLNSATQEIDKQKKTLSDSYQPQIANKPGAATTLNAFMNENTFRPSPVLNVHGQRLPRDQVQQYYQQYKADPPDLPGLGAALGSQ